LTDRRLPILRAVLGFLEVPPRAPELRLLHTWTGVGLISVGVERLGYRLSHIAEGEWRATFSAFRAGGLRRGADSLGSEGDRGAAPVRRSF
jgi:hypothetical protein